MGSVLSMLFDRSILCLQGLLFAVALYQLFLACFGMYRKKRSEHLPSEKTFAILVAAHNEETVIGALLDNLQQLDYPRELYDIYVICDNCTDNTAEIARKHGATPCERMNHKQRGKGFAIEWMLERLWEMPRSYDAVVMFDADNLVNRDFLKHMNDDLCRGSRVIQAYLDTKNPNDSWITSANAITYWFCNRFWQLCRKNLGLANFLGGTGMCFESGLLKKIGWGATSLVEDLEFSVRCIQQGIKPTLNYDAKVYDEKPLSFVASCRQRMRWVRGQFDVANRYIMPLLKQGFKEKSWMKIDAALYIFNVYHALITFIVGVVIWSEFFMPHPPITSLYTLLPAWLVITFSAAIYLLIPLSLVMEKINWRIYLTLITFPIFFASWWPITFYAFITQANKQWSHTEHTRVLRIEDVRKREKLAG